MPLTQQTACKRQKTLGLAERGPTLQRFAHRPDGPPMRTCLATLQDIDAASALFDAYRQFYEQAPTVRRRGPS